MVAVPQGAEGGAEPDGIDLPAEGVAGQVGVVGWLVDARIADRDLLVSFPALADLEQIGVAGLHRVGGVVVEGDEVGLACLQDLHVPIFDGGCPAALSEVGPHHRVIAAVDGGVEVEPVADGIEIVGGDHIERIAGGRIDQGDVRSRSDLRVGNPFVYEGEDR